MACSARQLAERFIDQGFPLNKVLFIDRVTERARRITLVKSNTYGPAWIYYQRTDLGKNSPAKGFEADLSDFMRPFDVESLRCSRKVVSGVSLSVYLKRVRSD